jgi:carbonic anhydrase/acetyltransferase-like protein (isoleucine patch superfamily)
VSRHKTSLTLMICSFISSYSVFFLLFLGHGAVLQGCTIKDESVVDMGAVVNEGAVVSEHSVVAAGSVVAPGEQIPSGQV